MQVYFQNFLKKIKLLQYLLSAAEKVGEKQFHRAGKILKRCDKQRHQKGYGIQRLVYYFSAALHERIDRQTKKSAAEKDVGKNLSLYIENILSKCSTFQPCLLMQALATRAEFPVEYLKITAVGIHCKAAIEETGKRLTSFAETFNLSWLMM